MKLAIRILVYFSTAIMLTGSFAPVIILSHFYINRAYIASELCINRDKPMTMCGGRCYLNDQMQKVTYDDEQDQPIHINLREITYFFQDIKPAVTLQSFCEILQFQKTTNDEWAKSETYFSIFHPPQI